MTASSNLTTYLGYGLAANRPASPANGTALCMWYATDTGVVSFWTGASWQNLPASALTQISQTVTAGSAASVTFSSIASTYTDLIVTVQGRGDNASVNVAVKAQFNADTGANYDGMEIDGFGTSNAWAGVNVETIAATSCGIGYLPGASAPANVGGSLEATLLGYSGTTFQKSGKYHAALKQGTTTGNFYTIHGSVFWRNTTAINAVKVFLSAGNFVNGSVVTLYGRT